MKELPLDEAAKVLSYMDSDDAADILDEMDDSTQENWWDYLMKNQDIILR